MAALVLKRLYPVVSDVDLTATYSDLENLRPSSMSSYQQYIGTPVYGMPHAVCGKHNYDEGFCSRVLHLCLDCALFIGLAGLSSRTFRAVALLPFGPDF